MKYNNIREEELKNKVGADFFADFDTTEIPGNIDFCVKHKQQGLFKHEGNLNNDTPLLWAEAKTGNYDTITMFVQLILTIGKARTFDKTLAPLFLGAFDFGKFAFVEYNQISDIFYQNDFNRNVTPSNHETREFGIVKERVANILNKNTLIFDYKKDEEALRSFIKTEFNKQGTGSKIKINKNNFLPVYLRRLEFVKPYINADRELYKKNGILDTDFFLADLFVDDHNTSTISDDESIKKDLFVIFENGNYKILKENLKGSIFDATITLKNAKQYEYFWKGYKRPPLKEYQKHIIERRDLLVPQDIRERKGAFFTPRIRVEKSQEYIADYFGENWQEEYYVRDCAAGTGNLLAGLTNKVKIYASTLDIADVNVMKSMAENKTINLLENHIFQFDFLNDEFIPQSQGRKLPDSLYEIITDEEKRKKLILYINPPYAEAGNARQLSGTGENKSGTAKGNRIYQKYGTLMGKGKAELFAQFLIRIYQEIPKCKIAEFSKLKILQSQNFSDFRKCFLAKLEKIFVVPGNSFDNVKGNFPIGFKIWETEKKSPFEQIQIDVYDKNGEFIGNKLIYLADNYITKWILKDKNNNSFGMMDSGRSDFQHQKLVRIENNITTERSHALVIQITTKTINQAFVFFGVRHCIPADWLNDRDQFLRPKDEREQDSEFQTDCLAFTLFHGQNRITSQDNQGVNHRIPFTEQQINARDEFKSHFMTDFIKDKTFSPVAHKVFEAGQALWSYYHETANKQDYLANASLYEIREYFQGRNGKGKMNSKSEDATYNELITKLRSELKNLASKIAEKVYEYEFLKR